MCIYGNRKTTIDLILFIVFNYVQFESCNTKLLKQLAHQQIFIQPNRNLLFNGHSSSPCPNIFEYRYDDLGRLYGYVEIIPPDSAVVDLEIEISVANRVDKGAEGTVTLPYQNNQDIFDIVKSRRPLNYHIHFPTWLGLQPKITKIIVNGKTVCKGSPYKMDNTIPVLTNINLRHKLLVDVSPLVPSVPKPQDNQDIFSNVNTDKDSAIDIDIRRDSPKSFHFGNPYHFNPNIANDGHDNTNPYLANPFLKNFSSDAKRKTNRNAATESTTFPIVSSEMSERFLPRNISTREPRYDTTEKVEYSCGLPLVTNSLVLNGQKVPRGAFPWLVAMFVKNDVGLEYRCAGTLISNKHVVTAAHCVNMDNQETNPDKIVLVMGRLNIQGWGVSEGERIVGVDQLFVHPDYQSITADADIAVMRTKVAVGFSKFIVPICLWNDDSNLSLVVGKKGTVVGWGRDESGHKVSPDAKQIELPIVSQEQCLRSKNSFLYITSERTFCAGSRDGTGPCNGDSGSGFIMQKDGRWYLRGIVSMSLSDPRSVTCDLSNYLVFNDASKYSDWLLTLIN